VERMANTAALQQVEQLIARLPLSQQVMLAERVRERASATMPFARGQENTADRARHEQLRLAEELLAEVEGIEDDSRGEFKAAEAIRRTRDERILQVCPKGV